jgi:hypothetical protein
MNNKVSINDCRLIDLGKIHNKAGNITVIENTNSQLPFRVKRVFYLYDIPSGEARGAHAHRECHQIIIAASGSFEIELDDSISKKTIMLNRPFYGLHIPPGIWAQEINFSSGSICLVMTSEFYMESDYIRDYSQFINYKI